MSVMYQVAMNYYSPPFQSPSYSVGLPGSNISSSSSEGDSLQAVVNETARSGLLFVDSKFPPNYSSLGESNRFGSKVEWKRPHDIARRPKFFSDGASRFDVKQGELGDCWLLAAISNLTLHSNLFHQIVPPDQEFNRNYKGFFYFRFWRFGKWVEVVVDDLLPTVNGQLIYLHSSDSSEFWSALLEKAYAKLCGSYEALIGGRASTAMDDFTGGVSEIFDLSTAPKNLFEIMLKGFERGSLMSCSIQPNPDVVEQRCSNGLIKGHAYSVTSVKYCFIKSQRVNERVPLIRIRNPWGNEAEWNGAWSDTSDEWRYVSTEERKGLGLVFDHDGEFWMSFMDFQRNFSALEMTNINLESLTEKDLNDEVKYKWDVKVFEGSWIRGITAGGCSSNPHTFWNNPKFSVVLREEDDGDGDKKCTMLVALLQKPRKERDSSGKSKLLSIGFSLFHCSSGDVANDASLRNTKAIEGLQAYINHRQVSFRFQLPPGCYCIVPTSYYPDEEADFMLRVFSEKPNVIRENDNPIGFVGPKTTVASNNADDAMTKETESKMKSIFENIAGVDNEVDWKELQLLLNKRFQSQFRFEGFSNSACRSMVAMLDIDRSGKLGFSEFIHLWNIICLWKDAFQFHDKDKSGKLSGFEFRDALLTAGFQVSNRLFVTLITIYGDDQRNISFDDFVLCAIRMSKAMRAFTDKDFMKTNNATFSLEEFMQLTLCI